MCRKIWKTTAWFCISGNTHMGQKCLKRNYALTCSFLCKELKLQWFSWNRIYCCNENWQNIKVILLKLLAIRHVHINSLISGIIQGSKTSLLQGMCICHLSENMAFWSLHSFWRNTQKWKRRHFAGQDAIFSFRHWKINCLFSVWQVNMVIGILVFNKLVSRDGILDKKLKHRAG